MPLVFSGTGNAAVNSPANKQAIHKDIIKKSIEEQGCAKTKGLAIASLYSASGGPWVAADVYGAVVLAKATDTSLLSLDFVYLEPWQEKGPGVLLWRHYLYYDFHRHYRKLTDVFHCFDSEDCVFGIGFLDAKEAHAFYNLVIKKSGKECARRERSSSSASLKGLLGLRSDTNNDNGAGANKKNTKTKKLTVSDMSDPTNFQHLIHIGYNPVTGTFEPRNVPPEWAEFFQRAGLSKEDLEDKETASCVAKFVQDNVVWGNAVKATSAAGSAAGGQVNEDRTMPGNDCHPPAVAVEHKEETQERPGGIPQVPAERANLMESIRRSSVQSLKPTSKQDAAPSTKPVSAGSDLMASMLAKALQERNQKPMGIRGYRH